MPISLNPGFALLLAAALALVTPRGLRPMLAVAAAALAGALALTPDFGAHDMFRQVGLTVVPLRLDAAAQIFGLAFAGAGIVLGLAMGHRRDAREDCALLAHLGGAMTAVFGGDLVTFAVGAEISILAAAALVLCGRTPGARSAAQRFVILHALAGALFVVGVGLVWAQTSDVRFDRLDATAPAGLCMLLGCLIRVGAPFAHVWIKDAPPRAGVLGFAALAPVTTTLALYALIRMFPGEPALAPIGAAGLAFGLAQAAASAKPRTILAYATMAQTGLLVMALGVGAPLIMAGVSAAAFAGLFAALLAGLIVGWATREGAASTEAPPIWRAAPATAALACAAIAAVLGLPGFATFATGALLQDAFARQAPDWMLAAYVAAGAGAVFGAGRAIMVAVFGKAGARGAAPPFELVLATFLAAFFLVAIGIAPAWLFGLAPPSPISFFPYDWDHIAARLQLIAAAGLILALSALAPLARRLGSGGLRDVDWIYRRLGPSALAGISAALRGGFSLWTSAAGQAGERLAAAAQSLGQRLDRQVPAGGRRAVQLTLLGAAGVVLVCALAARG